MKNTSVFAYRNNKKKGKQLNKMSPKNRKEISTKFKTKKKL